MSLGVPTSEPLVDKRGYCTARWQDYLVQSAGDIQKATSRVASVALTGQSASITTTTLATLTSTGMYAVRIYARITTPGSVSSSLTVTIGWTDDGQAVSYSLPALTGNLVTSFDSGSLPLLYCDSASPVTYETTYAANAAGSMQHSLYLVLEKVDA